MHVYLGIENVNPDNTSLVNILTKMKLFLFNVSFSVSIKYFLSVSTSFQSSGKYSYIINDIIFLELNFALLWNEVFS